MAPSKKTSAFSKIQTNFPDSELVIGIVGSVGTDLDHVKRVITERLKAFQYETREIRISRDIIPSLGNVEFNSDNYIRINDLMTEGNRIREKSQNDAILALAAAAKINEIRISSSPKDQMAALKRHTFIISSLKHPDEVEQLRKIYSNGFFLIGVYTSEKRRFEFLTKTKLISKKNANSLIARDTDESETFGQHTRDTYHLSDFFVSLEESSDKFQNDVWRIVDLIFGRPYITPTFDEFAMFMAFSASLRSADLSRQVGAIVAKNDSIVSTGANDVPRAGGGLYWPHYNKANTKIIDDLNGRDYKRGADSNAIEKISIIDDILNRSSKKFQGKLRELLKNSKIKNITEYGRVVHAEMEALLACARNEIGTAGTVLYCTTYPCHNCAKHIISAGVKRVVYVEPYPKSKALEFHSDAITHDSSVENKVVFEPFVGVGPRSFFNLFSMNLGSGYPVKRKDENGKVIKWKEKNSSPRMKMTPSSYIEREILAAYSVSKKLENLK